MDDALRRLDGARDYDSPEDMTPNAFALDPIDRSLTAAVLKEADGDLVCLQEVFDEATLDYFHDTVLVPSGASPYPYRTCSIGNDGHGLNVAAMSRRPFECVISHSELTPNSLGIDPVPGIGHHDRIFRRDCLEVCVGKLYSFICHFKAPYPDPAAAYVVRRVETLAVRRLVEQRFGKPRDALWIIVGDLNEPAGTNADTERAIAPLLGGFAEDLLLRVPEEERWSFYQSKENLYSQPDALLASPALAAGWPDIRPQFLRAGLDLNAQRYGGPHFRKVGKHRPHASDHAAVTITFAGL